MLRCFVDMILSVIGQYAYATGPRTAPLARVTYTVSVKKHVEAV